MRVCKRARQCARHHARGLHAAAFVHACTSASIRASALYTHASRRACAQLLVHACASVSMRALPRAGLHSYTHALHVGCADVAKRCGCLQPDVQTCTSQVRVQEGMCTLPITNSYAGTWDVMPSNLICLVARGMCRLAGAVFRLPAP